LPLGKSKLFCKGVALAGDAALALTVLCPAQSADQNRSAGAEAFYL
jgi:hypothetical protein